MSTEARRLPPWLPPVVVGALLGTVITVASAVLDGARPVGPASAEAVDRLGAESDGACGAWALLAGSGQVRGPSVSLFSDGVARFSACDDVERELHLRGTAARGVAAFAVVEDAEGIRLAGFVDAEIDLRVRGDVRLHFSNDLATADEDRNLHAAIR
jgi:hypothetical protein